MKNIFVVSTLFILSACTSIPRYNTPVKRDIAQSKFSRTPTNVEYGEIKIVAVYSHNPDDIPPSSRSLSAALIL